MNKCKIRLMSHNLWKNDNNRPEWESKGLDCSAEARYKGFVRVYKDLLPDIIGCQEMSALMAEKLINGCSKEGLKYALLWGKDTPIFYRPEKFELVDSDYLIYPEEVPGYKGCFNNYKTKSWSIAVFRIKENGKLFIFASTHLWWKSSQPTNPNYQPHSAEARVYQINLLIEKIRCYQEKYNCPSVIVGDLNAGYDSKCVQSALNNGYSHAHDIATEYVDESAGLHYCFGDGFESYYYDYPFERAIDHILINGKENLVVRRFERYSPEYYLPLSDHSPTFIDAEI